MRKLIKKFHRISLFCQMRPANTYSRTDAKSDKIVLLRLDAIGDFVMSYGTFCEYRDFYQDKKIILICSTACKALADIWGIADEVVAIDIKRFGKEVGYRNSVNKIIKNLRVDLVIQMVSYRSLEMESIAGLIPCPVKIAFSKKNEIGVFQSKRIDRIYSILLDYGEQNDFEIKKNFYLFNQITKSKVIPYQRLLPKQTSNLQIEGKYFVIAPGGSFQAKKWGNKEYADVINRLLEDSQMICCILGDANDVADNEIIGNSVIYTQRIRNLTGQTTVLDCVELIRHAQFLVTNDTCFVHIAVAVNTPSICIVGGWHWGRFLPYDVRSTTEVYHFPLIAHYKMDCYRCNFQNKKCKKIKGGNDREERLTCIKNISVDSVMKLVLEILNVTKKIKV